MNSAQRIKAIYNFQKVDRLPRREFSIWEEAKARWRTEGWDGDMKIFNYDDETGFVFQPINLGWTDAPIMPGFKEEIIEKNDNYEYVRTSIGEVRMYPKDIRHGVMPVFVKAPVESRSDWFEKIKSMLSPNTKERYIDFENKIINIINLTNSGKALLDSRIIGGYMYLRSLLGPENVLYVFHDDPELVHDMMKTWLTLQTVCLVKVQERVPFFKLFMGEDIAYKNGPLISPAMVEEFLMPYYRELIETLRSSQKDFMHVEVDTDGNPDLLLPIYIKNGFTAWSPCEVAAGL